MASLATKRLDSKGYKLYELSTKRINNMTMAIVFMAYVGTWLALMIWTEYRHNEAVIRQRNPDNLKTERG